MFDAGTIVVGILSTVLSALVLSVFTRVGKVSAIFEKQMGEVKDLLSQQSGRIGNLEIINVEREKMNLEHAERVRGDLAEVKGKFENANEHYEREFRIIRDRQHEFPNQVNSEMLRIHVKIARLEQRVSIPLED